MTYNPNSKIVADDPIFDSIGGSYSKTRSADPRIVKRISDLLGPARHRTIADIGAGTGNYSVALAEQGWSVVAVEPSLVMRSQSKKHPGVTWIAGSAESLSLPARRVDAVVCVLALHHFRNMATAFAEMARVVKSGPIVLFTFDPRVGRPFWLADYFPDMFQTGYQIFPPIEDVKSMLAETTGRMVTDVVFPLPPDLNDVFLAACWKRPELYLQPDVRAGMSAFMLAGKDEVARGLDRLSKDLKNGAWQHQYGQVLTWDSFDAGYRFIVAAQDLQAP